MMKKKIPNFETDAEAERFVDRADLSKYDLAGLVPVQFEFDKKTAQLNMRLPKRLLDAVKKRASARGMNRLRAVRAGRGFALGRLAARLEDLGVPATETALADIEAGKATPTPKLLAALAKTLGVTPGDLVG